ncbi:nuclear transport factor 2 family protein [Pseudomonas sp. MRSN 12121]|uniref:YybH family protein n=1 Tax=Pseudomonas sp. MRSN 12121 TaxID=1611770 RepID=UPI0009E3644F|nr:nuclear transport factor 2 family protein [Pseudomonas sp. MRSN 12121]
MFKSLTAAAVLSLVALNSAQAQEPPRSPSELAQAFERHFNAADLEGLGKLYGKDSLFVPAPGMPLQEPAQIRAALAQFMAAGLPIRFSLRQVYQADDIALVVLDWTIRGTGADGKPVDMAGTGADVMKRQADGTWIYAIDNPFGVAQPAR